MKRARDCIIPCPPATLTPLGRIVCRLSPLNLVDGDVRNAVAWNPEHCCTGPRFTPAQRAEAMNKISAILDESARDADITCADASAWQFITNGPRSVRHWDSLDPLFKNNTRFELGFSEFPFMSVRVLCVDESDSENYASDESSEGEESAKDSDDDKSDSAVEYSDEVSSGPIDVWLAKGVLDKKNKK